MGAEKNVMKKRTLGAGSKRTLATNARGICRVMPKIAFLVAVILFWVPSLARAQSYPHMRYNQVRQKNIHNAMSKEAPILDMILYHDVRVLEFDIHNGKNVHGKLNGDWWLYHSGDLPNESAEHTAETLSDALKEVQTFHRQNPHHEVFTFYIDQHDDFESGRMPKDLDALIDKFFPFNTNLEQSATFTPFHLLHSGDPKVLPVAGATECPCATMKESSLQACVDGTFSKSPACQWPLLSTLQGKIIFVVTGGNDHADEYVDHGRAWQQRRAFATYDHKYVTSRHFDKKTNPNGFDRVPWEVFFNQENGDSGNVFTTDCHAFPDDCKKPMQQIIFEKHLVGRSFGSGNEDDWNKQRKLKVQLIGTDLVDEADYPYASTHGLEGFPFQCALTLGDGCGTEVEARGSPVFNFTVNTEDFNNNNDPDSFAYAEQLDKKDRDYILQVSSPSGSVEDWAKACLMARSDQGARAAYFAVCRTANSTRTTAGFSSSRPIRSRQASPTPKRTKRNANARNRWPRSIAPRRPSSPTSAMSSARRSR